MPDDHPFLSYRPSAFYFREAIRQAKTKAEVATVALQCIRELEATKAWIRANGLVPPRRFILETEATAKGIVIPFPSCVDRAASE